MATLHAHAMRRRHRTRHRAPPRDDDRPTWLCRRCAGRHAPSVGRDDGNAAAAARDDDGRAFDYIVVGLGAAGSALARALSDDPSVSVLALDWGPDRRNDPTAADLLRGADVAHDPGTALRIGGASEPSLLGARCALGGGRAVGGSTLVDSALWGTGGAREWRDFARACARASPHDAAAGAWTRALAAAASVPLARVEAYSGPRDAVIGGAPSSSSATSVGGRRHWDPGGARERLPYGGDVPDRPTRGTGGPVHVQALPPAWDSLSDAFVEAAGRVYGVREVADHNGPAEFGVARHVQFAVRIGPPHGFNRQPAGAAFIGRDVEASRCSRCRLRRRLTVAGGAHVERVLFEPPARGRPGGYRAVGVRYLDGGARPVDVHARRRVVLCASALTSALLQRSGIGDPRLLAGIGVAPVVLNPSVGLGYHCPYGFRMVASMASSPSSPSPDLRSDLNPPGTVGIVLAHDPTRPLRRRRQWCVLAAAGPLPDYWPVAGDPLLRAAPRFCDESSDPDDDDDDGGGGGGGGERERGAVAQHAQDGDGDAEATTVTLSAWLLDPTSRGGSIETPSADPSIMPRARLGLFTDRADVESMRALAKSVAALVAAMPPTPDGRRFVLTHPAPEVVSHDDMLELWLRTEAFYVAHRHGGVCRVGRADKGGVVDGLLRVHGVDGLSVCDSTVFDHGMGPGTTAGSASILGIAYADMILDGLVSDAVARGGGGTGHRDGDRRDRRRESPKRKRRAEPQPSQGAPPAQRKRDDRVAHDSVPGARAAFTFVVASADGAEAATGPPRVAARRSGR